MAQRPMLPETDEIDGSETIIIRKGANPYRALLSRIISSLVKLQKGDRGDKGDVGPAGPPKRVERYTATTNASGIANISFAQAFTTIPDVQVITGWVGEQMISGAVTSVTTAGCSVQVMVSRGTLLLTTGPFRNVSLCTANLYAVSGQAGERGIRYGTTPAAQGARGGSSGNGDQNRFPSVFTGIGGQSTVSSNADFGTGGISAVSAGSDGTDRTGQPGGQGYVIVWEYR